MNRRRVRAWIVAGAFAVAGLTAASCTTTTVFGKTPTMQGTWTAVPTWTPPAVWTPTQTPTPQGYTAAFTVGSYRLAILGTPVELHVSPMVQLWDRATLVDIAGFAFQADAPSGVQYLNTSPTPSPVGTRTMLTTGDPSAGSTGRYVPSGPGGPGARVNALAAGDSYAFSGTSIAYGAIGGSASVTSLMGLVPGIASAPPTPVANSTFFLNWSPVAGAMQYGVQILRLSNFTQAWPPTPGPAIATSPPITVAGGLPSTNYLVLVYASDQPLNTGDPTFWGVANVSNSVWLLTVP